MPLLPREKNRQRYDQQPVAERGVGAPRIDQRTPRTLVAKRENRGERAKTDPAQRTAAAAGVLVESDAHEARAMFKGSRTTSTSCKRATFASQLKCSVTNARAVAAIVRGRASASTTRSANSGAEEAVAARPCTARPSPCIAIGVATTC